MKNNLFSLSLLLLFFLHFLLKICLLLLTISRNWSSTTRYEMKQYLYGAGWILDLSSTRIHPFNLIARSAYWSPNISNETLEFGKDISCSTLHRSVININSTRLANSTCKISNSFLMNINISNQFQTHSITQKRDNIEEDARQTKDTLK